MQLINSSHILLSHHTSIEQIRAGCSLGKRTTRSYELDFILSADGGWIETEGVRKELRPHMIFFRPPGLTVEGFTCYTSWYMQFQCDSFIEDINHITTLASPQKTLSCFETLYRLHLHKPNDYEYKQNYYINSILFEIFSNQEKAYEGIDFSEDKRLTSCIAFLEFNWNKPFSLVDLIDCFGYSKSHFFLLFKKKYQITPLQYLIRLRMAEACRQLLETGASVKEIQYDCGYTNEQLFFRHFKKHTGYSPLEYRRIH